jgi:hypothetical protein
MGGPYDKLPRGCGAGAWSVTAWNRMLDMLRWWLSQQAQTGSPGVSADQDVCMFDVQNNTGSDQDWLAVVGLDGPVFTPTDNLDGFRHKPMLKGVTPATPTHRGKWAVLLSPCPSGDIVKAAVAGVVPVRVYINNTADKFCDVIDAKTVSGETCYLGTGDSGAQILWTDGTTANHIGWAIVRLGQSAPSGLKWAKLYEILEPCKSAAAVNIDLTDWCTKLDDIRVYDHTGVGVVLFPSTQMIPANAFGCYDPAHGNQVVAVGTSDGCSAPIPTSGCGCCNCPTEPVYLQVTVSGLVDTEGWPHASAENGTYLLSGYGGGCSWAYVGASGFEIHLDLDCDCDVPYVKERINLGGALCPSAFRNVTLSSTGCGPIDCSQLLRSISRGADAEDPATADSVWVVAMPPPPFNVMVPC